MDATQLISLGQGEARGAEAAAAEQAKKVARQFEALFVGEVFKAMRKTVGGDHQFGHQMYTELFDEKLSEHIAESGIGLADVLVEELSPSKKKAQEMVAAADI